MTGFILMCIIFLVVYGVGRGHGYIRAVRDIRKEIRWLNPDGTVRPYRRRR